MTELRKTVPIENLDQVRGIEVAVREVRNLIERSIVRADSLDSRNIPPHFAAGYREVEAQHPQMWGSVGDLPVVPVLFVAGKGAEVNDMNFISVNQYRERAFRADGSERILRVWDTRTLRAVAMDIEIVDSGGNGDFYLRYLNQGFCITRPDKLQPDAKQLDVIGLLLKKTGRLSLDASVFPLGIPREFLTAFDSDFNLRTLSDVENLREQVSRERFAQQFARREPQWVDIGTPEAERFYLDWLRNPSVAYEILRDKLTSRNEHLRDPQYEPTRKVSWGKENQIQGVAAKLGYRDGGTDVETGMRVEIRGLSHSGIENGRLQTAEFGADAENVELYIFKSDGNWALLRLRRDTGYKPDVEDVAPEDLPFWLSVLGNMHVEAIHDKVKTPERHERERRFSRHGHKWG